jgi:TATA-box binding protein (TBP) (component of TFIID and TFIIIB)
MAYAARLRRLRADINAAVDIENRLGGKAQKSKSDAEPTPLAELLDEALDACKAERKRKREDDDGLVGDGELLHLTRHTHNYALHPYRKFLHYVPRVVNVVSLAEAVPAPGSNVTLPLDVRTIASRCSGAFYAPSRFAAVQLAFSQPRSRILIFHTGHLVGTGTTGPAAARAAIVRAQRQLAVEAGIHLSIQSFQIKNQVGAVSLRASLNCDAFAAAHSADAHYDRASFVGLAVFLLLDSNSRYITHTHTHTHTQITREQWNQRDATRTLRMCTRVDWVVCGSQLQWNLQQLQK